MKSKNAFWKCGAYLALAMSLTCGMVGCSDDDPNYDDVTPPVVPVAPNSVSGVVTSIRGEVISGATVTLSGTASATATTDASGVYTLENVAAGEYTVRAEAEGYQVQEGTLSVSSTGKTQKYVWNASLPTDAHVQLAVSATEDTEGEIDTETLKDNELAEVNISAVVPAAAVEGENVEVELTPLYSATNTASTRAASNTMLIGAALNCNTENAALNKPVELSFDLDASWASQVRTCQLRDGEWVTVSNRIENGRVVIDADAFTSYGVFLDVDMSSSSTTQTIEFTQDSWDNLYGSNTLTVTEATYSYQVGTQISMSATDQLSALLIEKLAQSFGSIFTTVSGNLPVGVTLPIGTMLGVSGTQQMTTVSASALGVTVTAVQYGTITLQSYTTNRTHTGGSN